MSSLGKFNCYLGVEFTHVNSSIFMGQQLYVEEMLKEFNMQDYKSSQTPMTKGLHLIADMKTKEVDAIEYRRMVGKLIYLTNSRPNISFVVEVVSRFMAKPQESHLKVVKHIFCYLKGSIDYGIFYRKGDSTIVKGFLDLNWVSDFENRISTNGFVFRLRSRPIYLIK